MEEQATHHAMTEIALGLAMAFFAIMVLAMVSMAMPDTSSGAMTPDSKTAIALTSSDGEGLRPEHSPDLAPMLIIYFRDVFMDQQLQPLELSNLPLDRPWLLVISPELSVTEAITIKQRLPHNEVVITTLDARWMQRLEEQS